jgi:hypothetical protein
MAANQLGGGTQQMATSPAKTSMPQPWALGEIEEEVASRDAGRIARRMGGIVANDERIRAAVQAALDKSADARGVLAAVTTALTEGARH